MIQLPTARALAPAYAQNANKKGNHPHPHRNEEGLLRLRQRRQRGTEEWSTREVCEEHKPHQPPPPSDPKKPFLDGGVAFHSAVISRVNARRYLTP